MKKVIVIMLILMVVFLFSSAFSEETEAWFDHGLGQFIPNPNAVLGREIVVRPYSSINTDGMFSQTIDNVSYDEFKLYADSVRQFGYDKNIESYGYAYIADKDDKYRVCVTYTDLSSEDSIDYMMVMIDIIS